MNSGKINRKIEESMSEGFHVSFQEIPVLSENNSFKCKECAVIFSVSERGVSVKSVLTEAAEEVFPRSFLSRDLTNTLLAVVGKKKPIWKKRGIFE